jgi:GNAT superfamily N-acetyltransferase
MPEPLNDLPLDETSRAALAADGLDYAVVDTADSAAHERWLQAYHRGFHFDALNPEQVAEYRAGIAGPRLISVIDATAAEPEHPVATVGSWRSPLSLGDGRSVDGWAISLVSVAATHRRRGIARALLEGELRSAHAAGLPVAMLTVSEATIYGRWGFGPAAFAADYRIDTRGCSSLPRARPGECTA